MSGLFQDLFQLPRYDNIQINMNCIRVISINIKYEINQKMKQEINYFMVVGQNQVIIIKTFSKNSKRI